MMMMIMMMVLVIIMAASENSAFTVKLTYSGPFYRRAPPCPKGELFHDTYGTVDCTLSSYGFCYALLHALHLSLFLSYSKLPNSFATLTWPLYFTPHSTATQFQRIIKNNSQIMGSANGTQRVRVRGETKVEGWRGLNWWLCETWTFLQPYPIGFIGCGGGRGRERIPYLV